MAASLLWGVGTTNPKGPVEQSFVLNDGLLFIMDNHRAALWCWLQKIDTQGQYNLLHIDRHYDTLGSYGDLWDQAVGGQALSDLSLDQYLNAKVLMELAGEQPVFRYDNYIDALRHFYPNVLDRCYFATHKCGSPPTWGNVEMIQIDRFPFDIDFWFSDENLSQPRSGWVVNIDIDYFFYPEGDFECRPIFSDQYVEELFVGIREQIELGTVKVITIALSPSNTGNWNIARSFCDRICNILGWPNAMDLIPERERA